MSERPRRILHCDMDGFFAAIHRRDEPHLREVPLVVGGDPDGRGVVSTANYAARRYGRHSAMPAATAKRLCPEAVFLRPDLARYRAGSRRLMALLSEFSDRIEPVSLDEAYLELTDRLSSYPSTTAAAEAIRARVRETLGLTVSVGVANSRLVAKLASDWDKPDGLTVVPPKQVPGFLAPLPVRKLPGVGPTTERTLTEASLATVADLRAQGRERLVHLLGRIGGTLHNLAWGRDDCPVGVERARKSLGVETTFAVDQVNLAEMDRILTSLAERVHRGLLTRGLTGRTVTVKARYPDFRTVTRSQTLAEPPAEAEALATVAQQLLRRTEAGQTPVRLLGLTVANLTEAEPAEQLPLFR